MSPRRRALTPCNEPGCPVLVEKGKCDEHRRAYRRNQAALRRAAGDESMFVYNTTKWRTTRARILADHPDCAHCGRPASQVDHIIPRKALVAQGFHDPDAPHLLQSLCGECHHAKSYAEDGALGQPITPLEER